MLRSVFPRLRAALAEGVRPMSSSSGPGLGTSFGPGGVEQRDYQKPDEYFGRRMFDSAKLRQRVSPKTYDAYINAISDNGAPLSATQVDEIAAAMFDWASSFGANHYTHWFQPMSSTTGEKHDVFLRAGGHASSLGKSKFGGRHLAQSEPDGSSFPGGGLRVTHEARGYSIWDPSSPPFVVDHGNGATLYIPSVFTTFRGEALDEKLPLLRSTVALRKEVRKVLDMLGEGDKHEHIYAWSGVEQEFFFVDSDLYDSRPDLLSTGRTLVGCESAKGQQLSDQYFGVFSERPLRCMQDMAHELWELGIPVSTRHREVAPGQYEIAPTFADVNVAADRNMLMMKVMSRVARKHGLVALYHEKPFARVNGSGKHNNWSIGTDSASSLYVPDSSLRFMTFLAAMLRAASVHGDLFRVSVAGIGNDHRLGGHEAPPAIMSVYLGHDVQALVNDFLSVEDASSETAASSGTKALSLGLPMLAHAAQDLVDRNRTSPIAFTGNRFEFRAVGSSQNPGRSSTVMNLTVADSLRSFLESAQRLVESESLSGQDALRRVVRESLREHANRIVFNGDNYSSEWVDEAERRGLPNLRTTPEAVRTLTDDKNIALFERFGVLSRREVEARQSVMLQEYVECMGIEAEHLAQMAYGACDAVSGLVGRWTALDLTAIPDSTPTGRDVRSSITTVSQVLGGCETLTNLCTENGSLAERDVLQAAVHAAEEIRPAMAEVREGADRLERRHGHSGQWPFANYHDMMFRQD